MGLFDKLGAKKSTGQDAAARNYVLFLPEQMEKDHGIRYEYTADQVRISVLRAKLPIEHIALGYAMFLPRDKFDEANTEGYRYDDLVAKTGWMKKNR